MFLVLLLFLTRSCKSVIIFKHNDFCKLWGEPGATLWDGSGSSDNSAV